MINHLIRLLQFFKPLNEQSKQGLLIQGECYDYPMITQVYSRNKDGNEVRSNKLFQTTTTMRMSTYDNSSKPGNFRGRSSFLQTQYTGDGTRNHQNQGMLQQYQSGIRDSNSNSEVRSQSRKKSTQLQSLCMPSMKSSIDKSRQSIPFGKRVLQLWRRRLQVNQKVEEAFVDDRFWNYNNAIPDQKAQILRTRIRNIELQGSNRRMTPSKWEALNNSSTSVTRNHDTSLFSHTQVEQHINSRKMSLTKQKTILQRQFLDQEVEDLTLQQYMTQNKDMNFTIDTNLANERSEESLLRELAEPVINKKSSQQVRKLEMLRDFKRKLQTLDRPLLNEMSLIQNQIGKNISIIVKAQRLNVKKSGFKFEDVQDSTQREDMLSQRGDSRNNDSRLLQNVDNKRSISNGRMGQQPAFGFLQLPNKKSDSLLLNGSQSQTNLQQQCFYNQITLIMKCNVEVQITSDDEEDGQRFL